MKELEGKKWDASGKTCVSKAYEMGILWIAGAGPVDFLTKMAFLWYYEIW